MLIIRNLNLISVHLIGERFFKDALALPCVEKIVVTFASVGPRDGLLAHSLKFSLLAGRRTAR